MLIVMVNDGQAMPGMHNTFRTRLSNAIPIEMLVKGTVYQKINTLSFNHPPVKPVYNCFFCETHKNIF